MVGSSVLAVLPCGPDLLINVVSSRMGLEAALCVGQRGTKCLGVTALELRHGRAASVSVRIRARPEACAATTTMGPSLAHWVGIPYGAIRRALAMFRVFMNLLTRALGWNLVGRQLVFIGGEGPASDALRSEKCEVVEVRLASSNIPGAILVRLQRSIATAQGEMEYAVLIPRHSDFGAEALATTSICAYVFPSGSSIVSSPPDWRDMIAMMDVQICR